MGLAMRLSTHDLTVFWKKKLTLRANPSLQQSETKKDIIMLHKTRICCCVPGENNALLWETPSEVPVGVQEAKNGPT